MAYTAVVTKQSISKISETIYQCSIRVVVNEGQDDVWQTDISEQYNTNAGDLADVKNRLLNELRKQWDEYVAENNIFYAAAFDLMVGEIQTAANNYINK